MVDVFHHLSDIEGFLLESARCVKPGGVVIMIEPWLTPWSYAIYRYFHHEPLDRDTSSWQLQGGGPISGANSALPWIVFHRDLEKFKMKFPEWRIKKTTLHTPFSYLLSGGFSFRSIVPVRFFKAISWIEQGLNPLMPLLAMFATIILERNRR